MALTLEQRIQRRLGLSPARATRRDVYRALCDSVREAVLERWVHTEEAWSEARHVAYLSVEFHMGRLLKTNLLALDLVEEARAALEPFGISLDELEEEEPDARIASGGLGRLAACFLDSLATQDLPGWGYGLRLELGMFKQQIVDGAQTESPDPWLGRQGWPWERPCAQEAVEVNFAGHVEFTHNRHLHCTWKPHHTVLAVPYDIPVVGHGTGSVGTLRLWQAEPTRELDVSAFLEGDYAQAFRENAIARSLTTFLYPPDHSAAGQELRVAQQYFLAAASVADLLRRFGGPEGLAERCTIQLNDTHPVLAIPELMRILLDEQDRTWEQAWEITREVFAYTNHTLLPEALETWSVDLIGRLFPRHIQIMEEIDRRHQQVVRKAHPSDHERPGRVAIVDPDNDRVHMAHLGVIGSRKVNGVAALHTRLLREGLFRDFDELYPERFCNKTNGITPRRWLLQCNPRLASLISEAIGEGWERDLERLRELEPYAEDAGFRGRYAQIKLQNKQDLAVWCEETHGIRFDPETLLDVQVKRIHLYKRQLLLVLWCVRRALQLERGEISEVVPRTVLFAGKAAATYEAAKRVIRMIHAVGEGLEYLPQVKDKLRVIFIPDYKVSAAQRIIPAAEISEQISAAGYEASGTGNMKLSLNGAITIGTMDGANIEIREAVGAEHVVTFGLDAAGIRQQQQQGPGPRELYESDETLREVLDTIASFEPYAPGFPDLVRELLHEDQYCVLADFAAYCEAQDEIDRRYLDSAGWNRSAVLNTARMGRFSSDRTIREYAQEVWRLEPVPVAP
ncbi:MAG TPA: glycogen phosphorylase [Planctomycetes bacterium]|nr:glycogen phosphorylase [Planctomycetota bacterium]